MALVVVADRDPGPRLPERPASWGGPVDVRVGDTTVRAQVADTPARRAYGLMGRDAVPPGTGMVFTYAGPQQGRFWMAGVRVPLLAVFARDGRVVDTVVMTPCRAADLADCPRYASRASYDVVLEVPAGTSAERPEPGTAMTVEVR